ncbi:unnamed protein product [Anisakis simplex]|uniref:Probable signal recognition particle 19 kDa protein (inferred by orthology to a C. elegans protein) n=1 Tax=Anisakis simplex TaxID=6269 RepID=A0A0M3IYH1_ANISI|nr:unnamed protein product [Anisakis simplex]
MDASFDVYKSKRHSDETKWVCIYPLYINARKTVTKGRRVNKEKKHCMHPLDPNRDTNSQGRVRLQLRNDDGSPFNEKLPTSSFILKLIRCPIFLIAEIMTSERMSLLIYLCEMIPKLKNRQATSGVSGQQTATVTSKSSKKHKKR